MEVAEATETMTGSVLPVSGPSGVGKTEIKKLLCEECKGNFGVPVSDTNRKQRPDEVDGESYHFITTDEFLNRMQTSKYVYTWQHPKTKKWYGMRKDFLEEIWKEGKVALLDIGIDIHKEFSTAIPGTTIFFLTAGKSVRRERIILRKDGMTSEEIELRLEKGEEEIKLAKGLRAPFSNVQLISNETSIKKVAVDEILTKFYGKRPRSSQVSLSVDIKCFLTRLRFFWNRIREKLRFSKS